MAERLHHFLLRILHNDPTLASRVEAATEPTQVRDLITAAAKRAGMTIAPSGMADAGKPAKAQGSAPVPYTPLTLPTNLRL